MKTKRIITLVFTAFALSSCGLGERLPAYLDDSRDIEARVEDALERMTPEEKTLMVSARTASRVPGVPRLGIPSMGISDSMYTQYPYAVCLAATWDPALAALYGRSAGAEARFRGTDVLLGPGVNIARTPLDGSIGASLGEDPLLASRLIVPFIKGVQSQGIAAAVRHFALHNQQMDRDSVDVHLSDRALYEIYLPAFDAAVRQAGAWAVETAPGRYNGVYCAENKRLLDDILVGEWGFDGVVFPGIGKVEETDLDEQVRRLLRLVFRTSMDRHRPWGALGSPDHMVVARSIAEEGVVLLKNSNSMLPLEPENVSSILLVGSDAPLEALSARFGSQTVTYMRGYTERNQDEGEDTEYLLASLEEYAEAAQRADAVVFVGGTEDPSRGASDRGSLALPYGQDELISALVAANPRTAVIIHSSGPVAMPWRDAAGAIVQGWHLGERGDQVLAGILAGDINPSGKLPFTYYSSLSDCGAHALGDYPGNDLLENYVDDVWVGYRYTDMKGEGATPAFGFGHGLSYTTFEYSDIEGNKEAIAMDGTLKISMRVTNTGNRTGSEVVQLYIGDAHASVARPVKELKDFQRITLEPGRSTKVTFSVDTSALSFFDSTRHQWITEPGNFTAYVASSVTDVRGVVEFSVL